MNVLHTFLSQLNSLKTRTRSQKMWKFKSFCVFTSVEVCTRWVWERGRRSLGRCWTGRRRGSAGTKKGKFSPLFGLQSLCLSRQETASLLFRDGVMITLLHNLLPGKAPNLQCSQRHRQNLLLQPRLPPYPGSLPICFPFWAQRSKFTINFYVFWHSIGCNMTPDGQLGLSVFRQALRLLPELSFPKYSVWLSPWIKSEVCSALQELSYPYALLFSDFQQNIWSCLPNCPIHFILQ